MKILGIDYGLAKIGLALADDGLKLAVPFKIIEERNLTKQIELVSGVIRSELVDLVVVGWPLSLSGQVTAQTQETKIFIDKLAAQGFQVEREDERLSSRAAQKLGIIKDDAVAAMQILQTYLDRL